MPGSRPSGTASFSEPISRRIRNFPRPGSLGAIGLEPSADRHLRRHWTGAWLSSGEQGLETPGLGVGEQAGPGQKGALGSVEPVTRLARGFPLDAVALVELAGSQGHDARRGPSPPGSLGASRQRRS